MVLCSSQDCTFSSITQPYICYHLSVPHKDTIQSHTRTLVPSNYCSFLLGLLTKEQILGARIFASKPTISFLQVQMAFPTSGRSSLRRQDIKQINYCRSHVELQAWNVDFCSLISTALQIMEMLDAVSDAGDYLGQRSHTKPFFQNAHFQLNFFIVQPRHIMLGILPYVLL